MRSVIALSLVLVLNGGCANKKTALGLAAAGAAAMVFAVVELEDQSMYCSNAFDGEWGTQHSCNNNVLIGFGAGIALGLAAAVVWAQADDRSEGHEALEAKARSQRIHFLSSQATQAAAAGDCGRAQERTNRIAAVDPAAVGELAARDPAVRACLAPATNPAP